MNSTLMGEMGTMSQKAEHFPAQITIPSDPAQARPIQDDIENILRARGYSDREVFSIRLAVEEALINAIKHGNGMDHSKPVRIAYCVTEERFDIEIVDCGDGFCPEELPDPTAVENLERPCGRGVLLMRHYMTSVEFRGCGNCVSMTKIRQEGHQHNGKK